MQHNSPSDGIAIQGSIPTPGRSELEKVEDWQREGDDSAIVRNKVCLTDFTYIPYIIPRKIHCHGHYYRGFAVLSTRKGRLIPFFLFELGESRSYLFILFEERIITYVKLMCTIRARWRRPLRPRSHHLPFANPRLSLAWNAPVWECCLVWQCHLMASCVASTSNIRQPPSAFNA